VVCSRRYVYMGYTRFPTRRGPTTIRTLVAVVHVVFFFYNIIIYNIIYCFLCRPKTIALSRRVFPVSTTIIILLFYTRAHTHTCMYITRSYPKHIHYITLYIIIYNIRVLYYFFIPAIVDRTAAGRIHMIYLQTYK
jgi:hypothetical protein